MNEIGIRIYWGPLDGKFNPSPIVSVGNVMGSIIPSAPALVSEEQSWTIKIDEWKSVFASYSKERCVSSDSFLQLLICIVLPKGQRLAGEKSPHNLLDDVRSLFDQLFVLDLQAELPPKEKVDVVFAQLLSSYVLEKCPWYVFNMEGSCPASFCVESLSQLGALMRFNAYPALAHIEHLELGFKCKTTVNINTKGKTDSSTERKAESYEVWVNGRSTSTFLQSNDDVYTISGPESVDYYYENFHFSLGELKAAPSRTLHTTDNRTIVQLNDVGKRVMCQTKPIERYCDLVVKFTEGSDDEAKQYISAHLGETIKLMIGSVPWARYLKPSVVMTAIKNGTVSLSPRKLDGFQFRIVDTKLDDSESRFNVCIEAKREEPIGEAVTQDDKRVEKDDSQGSIGWIGKGFGFVLDKISSFFGFLAQKSQKRPGIALGITMILILFGVIVHSCNNSNREMEDRNLVSCMDIKSCRDYLQMYIDGKFIEEVTSHLERQEQLEFEAYNRVITFIQSPEPDIKSSIAVCVTYINKFPYGEHWKIVDSLKLVLEIKESILKEEKSYKRCFDKKRDLRERIVFCSEYIKEFPDGMHVHEVIELKNELENTIADKSAIRKELLGLVNKQDLVGFRNLSMEERVILNRSEMNAAEWILDYRRLAKSPIVMKEIELYLKDELIFPNKPFKSWNEVLMAKRRIDEIVRKYEHE